jgi:hypothetical protein
VFHSLEIGEGSRPYEYEESLRIVNTYRDHDIGRGIFSAQITVNRAASMRNGPIFVAESRPRIVVDVFDGKRQDSASRAIRLWKA